MPSMLTAILQCLVSSVFAYLGAAALLVAVALLAYRSPEMAWYLPTAFFIMAVYITQMLMLFCSSTEDDAFSSSQGRAVLGVFFLQAAANQVSYRIDPPNPPVANLVCLAAFAGVASFCLWRSLRGIQASWAEALLAPKNAKLR